MRAISAPVWECASRPSNIGDSRTGGAQWLRTPQHVPFGRLNHVLGLDTQCVLPGN